MTTTCKTLKAAGDNVDGQKTIKIAGVDTQVYCDMTTEGGGWTVVYAATGTAGEEPMTSDTAVAGNPLTFAAHNTTRALKIAISKVSSESLFVRDDGAGAKGPWLWANHEMFDEGLADPQGQATYFGVTIHDSSATPIYKSQIQMGWSRINITRGGDFGITNTNLAFDNHSTSYWMLNGSCVNQLLYSYTTATDSKAGYDVNVTFGTWTAGATACHGADGGQIKLYAAMR